MPSDCSVRLIPAKEEFGGWSSSLPLLGWRSQGKEEPTLSTAGLTLVVLSQGSVALKGTGSGGTKGGSASIFLEGKPKMCPVCLLVFLVCTLLFLRHVFTVDKSAFKPVMVFLPLPPDCWDCGFAPPCPACASLPN